MSDLERYLSTKREAETRQQQTDRAVGALESELKQIKKTFGCDSLEDAQQLLKKVGKQRKKAKDTFENEMDSFQEKWEDKV